MAVAGNVAENTKYLSSGGVSGTLSGAASVASSTLNEATLACGQRYPLAVLDKRFNWLPTFMIFIPEWYDFPPIP